MLLWGTWRSYLSLLLLQFFSLPHISFLFPSELNTEKGNCKLIREKIESRKADEEVGSELVKSVGTSRPINKILLKRRGRRRNENVKDSRSKSREIWGGKNHSDRSNAAWQKTKHTNKNNQPIKKSTQGTCFSEPC